MWYIGTFDKSGGGPTTKKTKDILRFSRRHDLFCSFLFSIWGHFVNEIRQKQQKRTKKINKDQKRPKSWSFLFFFEDTFLTKLGTKTSILNVFWKRTKKNKKDKGHLRFFPAAWSFLLLDPPPNQNIRDYEPFSRLLW